MWSVYTKTFVFRDCLNENLVKSNVAAIQKLLNLKQVDGNSGVFITTDILSVDIANDFKVYESEDDGVWNLIFYKDDKEICSAFTCDYKEIHLCFEIEEEVNTGDINIHYCKVKGFKDYQR